MGCLLVLAAVVVQNLARATGKFEKSCEKWLLFRASIVEHFSLKQRHFARIVVQEEQPNHTRIKYQVIEVLVWLQNSGKIRLEVV